MNDDNRTWFLSLDRDAFQELCRAWNAQHIGIEIPNNLDGYDQWLNFFKKLSPSANKSLYELGQDTLDTEAFSALARWIDILETPGRIDKIYQAGLTKTKTEQKTITELASENDEIGVLEALRDKLAEQLEKGTGARDTASLAQAMSSVIQQIKEAKRRAGPKEDTVLARLMGNVDLDKTSPKRTRGKGARDKSYMSKLTIKDVENE